MDEKRFIKEYILKKPVKFGNDTISIVKYIDIDDLDATEVEELDRKEGEDVHKWIKRFLLYITHPEMSKEHIGALKKDDYAALGKFALRFSKSLQDGMGLGDIG